MWSKSPPSKETQRQPEYFLVDRLPGSEIPRLLGRVVASKESPTDEYRPEDPRAALKGKYLEVFDRDFASLFWADRNKTAESKICSILDINFSSKEQERQNQFAAKFIRTRILPQHRDALTALLEKNRTEITSLLVENGGVAYMVVGVKSCIDGRSNTRLSDSSNRSIAIDLPVSDAVAAATHGIVTVGQALDSGVEFSSGRSVGADVTTTMVGEQVFAVRYRRIVLKKTFLSSKGAYVDYGQIQRAHFDAGVFDKTAVEETSDDDEEVAPEKMEDFDDEDIGLAEESSSNELPQGLQSTTLIDQPEISDQR